jgi:hypothetical protein
VGHVQVEPDALTVVEPLRSLGRPVSDPLELTQQGLGIADVVEYPLALDVVTHRPPYRQR